MQPVIKHRAVIVADLSQKVLIDEAIYVLYHGAKMWVKSYDLKSRSLLSINPKYSHLIYLQEDVHIVGRVLLTFTNL